MERTVEATKWTLLIIGFIPIGLWVFYELWITRNDHKFQTQPEEDFG